MTFVPTDVYVTCVTLPKDHCIQVPWKYINVDEVIIFQNLWPKSQWPKWPLDDL